MTHRQLPSKVLIILVEQRRLSRKMTQRQLPRKVSIILVEQKATQKITQRQLPEKYLLNRGG